MEPHRDHPRDDLMQTVSDLRAQPGGYIYVYGSAMRVRSLLAADLVDELLRAGLPICACSVVSFRAPTNILLQRAVRCAARRLTGL